MGEIVNIRGAYTGRFWQFNEHEADALLYLPHIDQVLYLMVLRRYMDFATGTVGVRRKVSYQMFKELLEVHRRRGSTKPDYYPKRDELRASVKRLVAAGLVEKLPTAGNALAESMVFKLPLAQVGRSVPANEEVHDSSTGVHTQENSALAGAGDGMNSTPEKSMNPTPRYIKTSVIKEYVENSSELSSSESNQSLISQKPKAVNQDQQGLGSCPQKDILELWGKYLPGKRQPNKNLWGKQAASKNLSSRWRDASAIVHSNGDRMLYSTREEGLQWWGDFFKYISTMCSFLMSDEAQFFNLPWLLENKNFMKTLDGNYEVRK